MTDDDLRRALHVPPSVQDNVSPRVQTAMQARRCRQSWARLLTAFAVPAVAGGLLFGGYRLAAEALPPLGAGGTADFLWLPWGLAAALVIAAATLVLAAIGGGD